jgi:rhodanese-related sulfurtransferase
MTTPPTLDMRTRKEFCTGHLCGAIHIETPLPPLSPLQVCQMENLIMKQLFHRRVPEGSTIAVYCKKGIRSKIAAAILTDMGYNALNLGGILNAPLKNLSKCHCS